MSVLGEGIFVNAALGGCLILLALGASQGGAPAAATDLKFQDPVASELVRDARLIYIGEQHYDKSSKQFLLWLLPQLKGMGFTHLGLEMVNASSQVDLDAYAASPVLYTERATVGWDGIVIWDPSLQSVSQL